MKIKMNKTVLLTGLFVSAVGLVGCSNNTAAIQESVDINKQNYTIESTKKNPVLNDYLEKTNLKFNSYKYEDEYKGLDISLSRDDDFNRIEISVPLLSKDEIVFKEQLNLAIKSSGFKDKDLKSVYSKIEECLSDEYLNSKKVAKKIKEDQYIEVSLLKNKDSEVTMTLKRPDMFYGDIRFDIETSKNNLDKYLKSSKIKFQEANYMDINTDLSLEQEYNYDNSVDLNLSIPLKNIKDEEFREQLKLMIESFGGTDKVFNDVITIIEGKLKLDEKEVVEFANDYKVCIERESLSYDEYDIGEDYISVTISSEPVTNGEIFTPFMD